ncbi:CaiB/BaiF CoA transferase family protein [Candidatus Raskinella chloraquaticus]|uniref:CaiB/BaiF CoA transferase family protein n=1 Tax=Candidatus Raskinella chloraquaticus TaxID=1951219 RepID=UPI0036722512
MTDDPPHAPATNGLSAPLDGIRIVELGAFIAGPFCGQLLGDLGADILKIEAPGQGDPLRRWGVARKDGKSLWWPVMARNKRSLSIDLRQADGAALARRVIASADVLIENFKPGTLEGFGLAPELLQADNQRLIIARVSGFGQTGPYAARPGFAAVAEAMAGLRIISGYPDRPPTRSGLSLADSVAGLYAALGVLAALRVRDQTGRGQVIDVALTEAALGISEGIIPEWSATGKVRERSGLAAPGFAPSNIYPCADTKLARHCRQF